MKYKNLHKIIFEYEQKVFVLLFAVFFIGFLAGSLSVFNNTSYIEISEPVLHKLYFCSILAFCAFLIILFTLGFTSFGLPFIIFINLFSGLFLSVIGCSITVSYGYVGCIVYSLFMLPLFLVIVLSLLYISYSSIRLSGALFNVFKSGTRFISPCEYLLPHIFKFIFFFLSTLIISIIYNYIFIPLFLKILWKEHLYD